MGNDKEDKFEDDSSILVYAAYFLLQYENIASQLLNVLRNVKDEVQCDMNFVSCKDALKAAIVLHIFS